MLASGPLASLYQRQSAEICARARRREARGARGKSKTSGPDSMSLYHTRPLEARSLDGEPQQSFPLVVETLGRGALRSAHSSGRERRSAMIRVRGAVGSELRAMLFISWTRSMGRELAKKEERKPEHTGRRHTTRAACRRNLSRTVTACSVSNPVCSSCWRGVSTAKQGLFARQQRD